MSEVEPARPKRRLGRPPSPHRKVEIVNAAADLFKARGFHSVGLAEIGESVGLTGPAIYRHFDNKHAILVAIINRAGELIRDAPPATDSPPAEQIHDELENYAGLVIEHSELIAVLLAERGNLPAESAEQVRRDMGRLVRRWNRLLAEARPDLSPAATRTAVNAAFGLLNSVTQFRSTLGTDDLREFLVAMATAALGLEPGRAKPSA